MPDAGLASGTTPSEVRDQRVRLAAAVTFLVTAAAVPATDLAALPAERDFVAAGFTAFVALPVPVVRSVVAPALVAARGAPETVALDAVAVRDVDFLAVGLAALPFDVALLEFVTFAVPAFALEPAVLALEPVTVEAAVLPAVARDADADGIALADAALADDPAFVDPAFVDPALVDPAVADAVLADAVLADPAFAGEAFDAAALAGEALPAAALATEPALATAVLATEPALAAVTLPALTAVVLAPPALAAADFAMLDFVAVGFVAVGFVAVGFVAVGFAMVLFEVDDLPAAVFGAIAVADVPADLAVAVDGLADVPFGAVERVVVDRVDVLPAAGRRVALFGVAPLPARLLPAVPTRVEPDAAVARFAAVPVLAVGALAGAAFAMPALAVLALAVDVFEVPALPGAAFGPALRAAETFFAAVVPAFTPVSAVFAAVVAALFDAVPAVVVPGRAAVDLVEAFLATAMVMSSLRMTAGSSPRGDWRNSGMDTGVTFRA